MENKEKQFQIATSICESKHSPPFTKVKWKIICEIAELPGFEEILFPKI